MLSEAISKAKLTNQSDYQGMAVYGRKSGGSSTLEHQLAMVEKIIELVIPEDSDAEHIVSLDQDKIQQTIDLGYNTGLIEDKNDNGDSIDDSYWNEAVK